MALKGKTNTEKIWNYFKDKGFTDCGIAGLMGNIEAESNFKSTNLQNSGNKALNMTDEEYTKAVDNGTYENFIYDGHGYGLVQHTWWGRKQGLLNYAKKCGKSVGDLQMQLDFIYNELKGYKAVFDVLKTAKTVREASDIVLHKYEQPADQSEAVEKKRASYGQKYYDLYATKTQEKEETPNIKEQPSNNKWSYWVQCGSYSIKYNAESMVRRLKNKGFDAIIRQINGTYKTQIGVYSDKKKAEEMFKMVKAAGFDAFIVRYEEDSKNTSVTSYLAKTIAHLNLRSSASSSNKSNIIAVIPKDRYVSVTNDTGSGWVQVQLVMHGDNYIGYVSKQYLSVIDISKNDKREVTADGLNARTDRTTASPKVFTMNKGDKFIVITHSTWGLILYKNQIAYANISNEYSKKI